MREFFGQLNMGDNYGTVRLASCVSKDDARGRPSAGRGAFNPGARQVRGVATTLLRERLSLSSGVRS